MTWCAGVKGLCSICTSFNRCPRVQRKLRLSRTRLEPTERGRIQRTALNGSHGLPVSGKHDGNAKQGIRRGCVQGMDCKVAPRTQTHSVEVCPDTYTMFKIEHPDHDNGVRDFKWRWWHDSDAKRDQDAKGNPQPPSKTPRLTVKNRRRRNQRKAKTRKKIRRKRPWKNRKRKKTNCISNDTWE